MGAWLEHERLGYNYRMDEMSAALGASQMLRLDSILVKRAAVAQMYNERLAMIEWLTPPCVKDDVTVSWFVYVVTLAEGVDRRRVIEHLAEQGVPARAYFAPVHMQSYIQRLQDDRRLGDGWDWSPGSLPVTEDIGRRTLALPFHSNLGEAEVERVADALAKALSDWPRPK